MASVVISIGGMLASSRSFARFPPAPLCRMLQRPCPGVNVNDRRVYGVIPGLTWSFMFVSKDNLPICHHRGP